MIIQPFDTEEYNYQIQIAKELQNSVFNTNKRTGIPLYGKNRKHRATK